MIRQFLIIGHEDRMKRFARIHLEFIPYRLLLFKSQGSALREGRKTPVSGRMIIRKIST
jgi:hypothetical protein